MLILGNENEYNTGITNKINVSSGNKILPSDGVEHNSNGSRHSDNEEIQVEKRENTGSVQHPLKKKKSKISSNKSYESIESASSLTD